MSASLPGEEEPAVYLLRDKEGKFQPVLNFSFEEFTRLYKLQHQLEDPDQKPRYVISNLQLRGTANAQHAELTAEFTIEVRDTGWVRVPLRVPGVILRSEPEYKGPGDHLLSFEDRQDGFVAWIRSEAGKAHTITLKLLAPLATVGGETQLKLNLPRAPLSELKLEVAADRAQARVSDGSELLDSAPVAGGKTALTVLRIGGDFELAWHAAEGQIAAVPVVLEATGALFVRIDGRSANTEARLTVRSFGGQFDRFRLRLPPRAEMVGSAQPGIQWVPVEGSDSNGKLIEIKLGRKSAGPVELRLVTERPHNLAKPDELLELGGFEVVGAVRQWGHIAVQVMGDWQIVWGARQNVRQVDELPEGIRREDLTAAFEYYVQPYSLTARVVPQKTRASVEPEYVVLVGPHQAQLQARCKYTVRGAKLRALDVDLPGWEVDEVGPPALVNVDAALGGDTTTWSIPLAQPTAGQFELTFRAHCALETGGKLSFEFPRPHADNSSQGLVAIVPADNVELAPDPESTFGLTSQALRPPLKLPERQQDALFYRIEGSTARFAASLKVHPQSITVDAQATVAVDEQTVDVEQRYVYQVAYEPADSLTLNVPRALPLDALTATLDGQRISVAGSRSDPTGEADTATPVRLALPAPRIGRCELKIKYSLTHDKISPGSTLSLVVPLITPNMGKLLHNQVQVLPQARVQATPRKGPWTVETNAPGQSGLWLTARQAPLEVSLALAEFKQRQVAGKTTIECGWIQTVLADRGRQERAVYRFRSGERELRLQLPVGAEQNSLDARLDGKSVATVETSTPREVQIPLVGLAPGEHVLELRYYCTERPGRTHLVVDPPEFRPATWMRRLYWELVLPGTSHVIAGPGDFTSETVWTHDGLLWQREPTLSQSELESLVGGGSAAPVPAHASRYLYSTVGVVGPLNVWIAARSVLVFGASLVLLAVGLAFIYFPVTRHPGIVLALGLAVLAGSLVKPEAALLLAQAASLGVVLTIVAALLARRALRRPVQPLPPRGSSRAVLDRSITEAYYRAAKGTQSSTATAPVAMKVGPPENES